jgi:uncharacterized protein YjbJ (UPF0337 family)
MANEFEGGLQEIAGRVQDTVGAATGDAGMQAKGKIRQVAGKVQAGYGITLDSVREHALSNPLATVAVAAGLGFLLGVYWSNRD